jgi:hypothetical protein
MTQQRETITSTDLYLASLAIESTARNWKQLSKANWASQQQKETWTSNASFYFGMAEKFHKASRLNLSS